MTEASSTDSFAEAHPPHWASRSAFQIIVFALAFTQAALAFAVYRGWFWLAVPLVLVASHFMHGLLVGFHEASHGLLRRNRTFNEVDGVLIGMLSLTSFSLYRAAHQTHHMHLAGERDEELWPFVVPGTPRWARVLAAFFELNFGLVATPLLFARTFFRRGSPIRSRKVRRRIWAEFALMIMVWTSILTTVAWLGAWEYFLWLYLIPACVAANLQSWRKYIEHVGLAGNTPISATRSIVPQSWTGRVLAFTLLHEPYHGVHHLRMSLPHPELPRRAPELVPTAPGELNPYPSYRHALLDLLRNLADPRVGGQWHAGTPRNTSPAEA